MDFLAEYGIFLAKVITIVVAIMLLAGFLVTLTQKEKDRKRNLKVKKVNKRFDAYEDIIKQEALPKSKYKEFAKEKKRELKEAEKAAEEKPRPRVFVITYKGDMKASATSSLREEITAIITTATSHDEVLIKLESPGGIVHEYGLAASQIKRLRDHNIPVTVAIDRVAASGGYMMACIANRIIAAPFAIVGSIGVIAQLPNFHRLLKHNHVEFEQIMAGEYKRTLSMFGENTQKDRKKMQEEVENVHQLFKHFVTSNRPAIDIDQVSTGEFWHAIDAKERHLVDELQTSDDYLLSASKHSDIFHVCYKIKKPIISKMQMAASTFIENTLLKLGISRQTY